MQIEMDDGPVTWAKIPESQGGGFKCQPSPQLASRSSAPATVRDFPLLVPLATLAPHLFVIPAVLLTQRPKLGALQRRAAYAHMLLEQEIWRQGYAHSNGDAERDPRVHGEYGTKGSYAAAKSLHKVRLARDFHLFRVVNGRPMYVRTTAGHKPFGDFWIQLGKWANWPLEWGGSDGRGDGNHYSYGWDGQW